MPPIEVTCANPECGEKFQVGSEMAGELVECPKCGASVYVLEAEDALQMMAPAEQRKGKEDKAHIAHPARLTCANCGAVLGVRDAFCPNCGADVRTGAAIVSAVERKKLNLVPFFIGGGILVALAALVVLVVFAVRIASEHSKKADAKRAAAAAAAAPLAQAAGAALEAKPKLAYEIPAQALTDLADRELKAGQAVDAYLTQLRQTLSAAGTADQMAAHWADLYQFCIGNDMQAEAEQAWYQAVRLGSRDAAVNQKLGVTDDYEGVPVTPAEKQFLLTLKPKLKVINRDEALRDCVVVIQGLEPAAIPLGKVVELQPTAGPIVLSVARSDKPDRPIEEFALAAEPGIEQTVEISSPCAAPSLPVGAMSAIYTAVDKKQEVAGVTVEHNSTGGITKVGGGDIYVLASSDGSLEIYTTGQGTQLAIIGRISLGNRFKPEGGKLFSGTKLHPLSFAVSDQTTPVRLSAGGYAVVHADMSDGLWGLLGAVNGDIAYECIRSRLENHLDDLTLENSAMEARGEFFGPWQTRVRLYDEMSAQSEQLQHALADRRSAAGMPLWRDRARLLGLSENTGSIYLNWPRFRAALAVAMKGSAQGVAERLAMIGQLAAVRLAQPSQLAPGMPPTPDTEAEPGPPAMPGVRPVPGMAQAPSFLLPQAAAAPDRDAAQLQPAPVPMDDEARTYALMLALPLLPDDVVLQKVQNMWPQLNGQQRLAALMALEQAATPQAIAWLGQLAQTATESDVTAMALLSLGAIGTKEALDQTEMPGVAAKVRAASLVAKAVAGNPDAIDQIPAFLATANADESAAFLQYITQFDTPGTLLALSHVVDACKDAQSGAKIAAALSRMGGKAAMRELSRLMDKTSELYADKLADLRSEGALLLVRQVGTAVAAKKTTDEGALHVLVADGSDASIAFLLAAAINENDAAAVETLARMGTAAALDAAAQAAKAITSQMLAALRDKWYSRGPKDAQCTWTAGVDAGAARKLLEKVFAEGTDPKARIAAAAMLQETGTPLPPDQLLTFAGSAAGSAPAGKFSLAGFEWPAGRPLTPEGTKLDGSPSLYAVGLALQAKDARLGAELQKLLGAAPSASLKAAACVALGRLGGDENLSFLHSAAAKTKDSYADTADMAMVLQDRLAALAGLADTQDAAFLPRVLDMLKESPPAASAVPKADNYEELADWWQIEMWRGACDCVAGICRQRSPVELTADSGLQSMLTDRLKQLIAEPGPKRESLSSFRQELRAAAIRAFGRVADFNDTDNSFVLSRLVVDLTQKASAPTAAPAMRAASPAMRAAAPGMRAPGPGMRAPGPGMPATAQSTAADPVRVALLDAVVHAGSRAQDLTDFAGYARTLTSGASLAQAWNDAIRQMAQDPTAGYFALLTAVADKVEDQTGMAVFDATRSSADAKGRQYGTFLASLVEAPAAAPSQPAAPSQAAAAAPQLAARQSAPRGQAPMVFGGPPTREQLAAFQARGRAQAAAAAAGAAARGAATAARAAMMAQPGEGPGMPEGFQGPAQPAATGVTPEYDRRLPYKRKDWQYKLDEAAKQAADLRQKWAIVQVLIESSGPALPDVVQAANLLTRSDLGPAAAPSMIKQDGSLQDSVVKQLGGLLAPSSSEQAQPAAPGAGPRAGTGPTATADLDARRAAVAALRQIAGQPAADALYNGLVGPQVAPQTPAVGVPMGVQIPIPTGLPPGMRATLGPSSDPVPIYIARALGSLGREDLLRNALKASDREFFQADALTVQNAALHGMAYLPAANNPMSLLAGLVRAATVEALRGAAADALVTASKLTGQQV